MMRVCQETKVGHLILEEPHWFVYTVYNLEAVQLIVLIIQCIIYNPA